MRAIDGTQLWQTRLSAPLTPNDPDVPVHPILANGMLYIGAFRPGGGNGVLYALHAADGTVAWSQPGQGTALTAGAGLVFVSSYTGITAFRGSTGARVWDSGPPPVQSPYMYPFFAAGAIYAVDGTQILALHASDGKLLWSYSLADTLAETWLTIGANSIYFAQVDADRPGHIDSFYSLNAQTGHLRWTYQMGRTVTFGAVEDGNLVYVANLGTLDALRVSDGQPVWQLSSLTFANPLLVNGVLFVKSFAIPPKPQPTCPPACESLLGVNALNASTDALYWRSSWGGIDEENPLEIGASSST